MAKNKGTSSTNYDFIYNLKDENDKEYVKVEDEDGGMSPRKKYKEEATIKPMEAIVNPTEPLPSNVFDILEKLTSQVRALPGPCPNPNGSSIPAS